MLEKLRILNDKILKITEDETSKSKHEIIKKILSDDKCFFNMHVEDAYAILRDLSIKEENLKSIYLELIDSQNL